MEELQQYRMAEIQAVWELYAQGICRELYAQGICRELYARADQPGDAVLMVACCVGQRSEADHMLSPQRISPPSEEQAPGNTAGAPRGPSGVRGRRRVLRLFTRLFTRLFNPLTRHFAGSRYFPLVALVRHRGRRSGRIYATLTMARPTADGFVVPLTFGEGADWYRNVQAAGGCVIRWRGTEYVLVAPEVVDWAAAHSAFSPVERLLLPLFGITRYVRLQRAQSQGTMDRSDESRVNQQAGPYRTPANPALETATPSMERPKRPEQRARRGFPAAMAVVSVLLLALSGAVLLAMRRRSRAAERVR